MFKAIIRFIGTAALCIIFYALGQIPGAPSVADVYDWSKTAIQRVSNGEGGDVASETIDSGRQIVISEFFSSADAAAPSQPAQPAENDQQQYTYSQPVAQPMGSSMPKCW